MILCSFRTLGGYMVTAVTVTVCTKLSEGKGLRLAGEESKGNREKDRISLSLACTQTVIRLYANDCATIRRFKR